MHVEMLAVTTMEDDDPFWWDMHGVPRPPPRNPGAGAKPTTDPSNDGPRRPPAMDRRPNSGFDSRDRGHSIEAVIERLRYWGRYEARANNFATGRDRPGTDDPHAFRPEDTTAWKDADAIVRVVFENENLRTLVRDVYGHTADFYTGHEGARRALELHSRLAETGWFKRAEEMLRCPGAYGFYCPKCRSVKHDGDCAEDTCPHAKSGQTT